MRQRGLRLPALAGGLPICLMLAWLMTTNHRGLAGQPGLSGVTKTAADAHKEAANASRAAVNFVQQHCADCHQAGAAEAGFDIVELNAGLTEESFDRWVEVFDRVADGEMPPADAQAPDKAARNQFLQKTRHWLNDFQDANYESVGRVQGRQLSHLQLERTLHDVLGIDIPLAVHLPQEQRFDGYTSIANRQSISHHQMHKHLKVIDIALDEAFHRATVGSERWTRSLTAEQLARRNPRRRCREPEMLDGEAVVWSGRTTFYGRLPVTTAATDGWYRLTIRARGRNVPKKHGIWCTVRTGKCVSSAPMLASIGTFELTDDVQEYSFTGWLPQGHMFEIRPGDLTLKQGRFAGGQIGAGEGTPQNLAGLALKDAVFEKVHVGPEGTVRSDAEVRQLLFGESEFAKQAGSEISEAQMISAKAALKQCVQAFAARAFRRPVTDDVVRPFVLFATEVLETERQFLPAVRAGYRAVLCSPRFLYFQELPGQLDDYAIATRLSYMLWNRPPNNRLLKMAERNQLQSAAGRRKAAQWMLADARAQSFVQDFADQWLQLYDIDFTEPDRRLYPGFDITVQDAMLQETWAYLQDMLDQNLSISHLIDSNHTFLNSRLARYYGINAKVGGQMQKVPLQPEDRRGGLVTHGAILKITANGSSTSPVIRGVWVAERLLGIHIPEPPTSVPAIEPDIRGAKTIRDMLSLHKSDTSCASCHVKIDPPGFALENYDPSGRYREFYPAMKGRKRIQGPAVDPSSELPDGRTFRNMKEFQTLVGRDRQALAANAVRHLIAYGTGAFCDFADRNDVEAIVNRTQESDFGFRSLLMSVITSNVFVMK